MAKKIVIIGGVAAGAAAATRARRLDEAAEIIMFEQSRNVSFASCGLPYHISGDIAEREDLVLVSPELFSQRFNIDVRVRHRVVSIDSKGHSVKVHNLETNETFHQPYDKLIVAPGASPVQLPIHGADSSNVYTLRNMEDMDAILSHLTSSEVGRAVVVGAGFIGIEMAESLSQRGISVSIVEMLDQVLPFLDPDMADMVAEHLIEKGVNLHLGDGLASIDTVHGRATGITLSSGLTVNTDLIIVATGVVPNTKIAAEAGVALSGRGAIRVNSRMETSQADILAAGDATETTHAVTQEPTIVPLAGPASKQGRLAGQIAASGIGPLPPKVAGTSIVRVFDFTVAATGLTLKAARDADPESDSVVAIRPHHVAYYPGAEMMTIKLIFSKTTGKILGAQIVGGQGVDRRIDVIATVIHFGGTLQDLADLDLAYSPQYGAAKDPVHIAAAIAQNQREGLVSHIQPREIAKLVEHGHLLVDVRTAEEHAEATIPGSSLIPLDELRSRLGELDPAKPTIVFCRVGQRAYVGARILMQNGFKNVANVAGGFSWYLAQGLPGVSGA